MLHVLNILLMPVRIVLGLSRFLLMAPIFWLGGCYRPFWRWFLRTLAALKIKPKWMWGAPLLWLEFERAGAWQEVIHLLDELDLPSDKAKMANAFSAFYFREKRLAESLEAANYWAHIPEEWAQEHPDEAHEALRWYRSQSVWYPFGFPHLYPTNISQPTSIRGMKQAVKEMKSMPMPSKTGMEMMFEWRDSRLMTELLKWIVAHVESGEIQWPLAGTPSKCPLMPLGFESVNEPRLLVARFDIPRNTFNQMWRRATKLD